MLPGFLLTSISKLGQYENHCRHRFLHYLRGSVIYLKLKLRESNGHSILQPAYQVVEGGHHPRRIFTLNNWILLSECRYGTLNEV